MTRLSTILGTKLMVLGGKTQLTTVCPTMEVNVLAYL